jgi:NADPH-dependent 2,4-dienoyl-CoA reductase/sulfur reductase-like enzyme
MDKKISKTDVLIIGSSAAGLVTALTGKKFYPDKSFTVTTKLEKTLIPCGIPYIFGSVGSSDNDILPVDKMFGAGNVDMIVDEAESIQLDHKTVKYKSGNEISYEKLVLCTGSLPLKAKWLKGYDKENVFTVPKDKIYLDQMHEKLNNVKKVIVIGAGFIGVEISDELKKADKEVILIEKLPRILGLAFDEDISCKVEHLMKERGVKVITSASVTEITGNGKVEGVMLDNGEIIDAEAVILSMGYKPNSAIAEKAGLAVSKKGFIKVDDYMRTENPDVFAVGDCAEKRDFITRKPAGIMLASTACAEARIAGMNLYKLSAIKTFIGTISIFSTAIGNTGFGVAGITEFQAESESFDYITGSFEGIDRHPGTLKDTHKQYVKLVAGRETGVILGGAVYGGLSAGELINTIGFIIQNKMTINSLLTAQIGTHPLLTASPAGYPLVKAAENIAAKIMAK